VIDGSGGPAVAEYRERVSAPTNDGHDGRIIERVQQADVLARMRQLYGRALGLVGLGAMFLRL
jgi:hypothetical protein